MLLSWEPAFLFVHIDKAAGSSIQLALRPFAAPRRKSRLRRRLAWLGPLNRWCGLYRAVEFPEHASARLAKQCLPPRLYAGLFKFAFVRNPWDRLVSRYAYLLRSTDHPRHRLVRGLSGFEEYLDWEIRRGKMLQYKYVADEQGRWLVDFIGYFERLHEDFAVACARLKLQTELPRANASTHRDYRTYYTPATRELVGKHFQRDLELLGYDFDGVSAGHVPQSALPR